MRTYYTLVFIAAIFFSGTMVLQAAEQKLAGIGLGMKRSEVLRILGKPHGVLTPLQPLEQAHTDPRNILNPGPARAGGGTVSNPQDPPNSMMFTDLINDKVEMINSSTMVAPGGSKNSAAGRNAKSSKEESFGGKPRALLPLWAYYVRALSLELGQEQYIYRINDNYSIGITFNGVKPLSQVSDSGLVTDIVVASLEPLKASWKPGSLVNSSFPAGTRSRNQRTNFTATTSKRLRIGSRFIDILKYQNWTPYCFPFTAEVSYSKTDKSTMPVTNIVFTRDLNTNIDTVKPDSHFYISRAEASGELPSVISDGVGDLMSAGFAKNCLLVYPEEKVAFTVVDLRVVRIQIGEGVSTPPIPPLPPTITKSGPGGSTGSGARPSGAVAPPTRPVGPAVRPPLPPGARPPANPPTPPGPVRF